MVNVRVSCTFKLTAIIDPIRPDDLHIRMHGQVSETTEPMLFPKGSLDGCAQLVKSLQVGKYLLNPLAANGLGIVEGSHELESGENGLAGVIAPFAVCKTVS